MTHKPTIPALEAKCREAIASEVVGIMFDPAIVLQLIEERRLLARAACKEPQFFNPLEAMAALKVRDRVLQEASECKSK